MLTPLKGSVRSMGYAVDRLSDGQLAAVQARVFLGWNLRRIAQKLGQSQATVEAWFREPVVIAAGLELQRAFIAAELLPLGLHRLRRELGNPLTKPHEVVKIVRLAADLAGLPSGQGSAGAGIFDDRRNDFAQGMHALARPLDECSADELRAIAEHGRDALEKLAQHAKPVENGD